MNSIKVIKIIAGIAASISVLWLAGAWFCSSPYILVFHPELGTAGFPAGCQVAWRSEGSGISRFGVWGVPAIPDIRNVHEPKIILWGDSYAEALQVDDNKKAAQQLTNLLRGRSSQEVVAVSAGLSGQSVADYLLKIPVYEKQMSPIAAHVVLIGQIEDLFPDQLSALYAKLASKPELHVIPAEPPNPSRLKWLAYQWGTRLSANGIMSVLRDCSGGFKLRFKPGPRTKISAMEEKQPSESDLERWFGFYAREFRAVTDKPLILVYLPTLPRMDANGWAFDDSDGKAAQQMERIFSENGWTVINMRERFIRCFKETGSLPRGFANTRPGSGHLNQEGHRFVAEAVFEVLP